MSSTDRRQNLARMGEIAQVAARHGFGYVFGRATPGRGNNNGDPPGTRGKRVRAMLDELGPTFVKFGQLLSTRPDVVPPDILAELRGLQDDARPEDFASVRQVVEEELGEPLEEIFAEFDETPIAAASIGQVHRAVMPSGDEVIVKVQRPDAERRLAADLQLLEQAAKVARERVRRLQFVDVVALVEEFGRSVRDELDYTIEARHAEGFHRNFSGNPHVDVPRIHWHHTTPRVLVMDRVEGTSLAHLDIEGMSTEDRTRLASRITETWMEMVFAHGLFHADPHPANIMVRNPDHIGLVDFGMAGHLSAKDREAAVRLLLDVVDLNAEGLPRRLRALGVRYPRPQEAQLAEQLDHVLQRYAGQRMGDLDARALLSEIFHTIYRLNLKLPARWLLLDKTLATLAGVVLQLAPEFNVFEAARPYARNLMTDRMRPDRLVNRLHGDLDRYVQALREAPLQISDLMEEIRDGEFEITVHPDGLKEAAERTESGANRLALAMIALGLLVSSAVVGTLVDSGPLLLGFAVIALPPALAGFVISAWLCLGILRSGRW